MENSNSEQENSNLSVKIILSILALIIIGAGAYIYKQTINLNKVKLENANIIKEKEEAINKLKSLEVTYENTLTNNTTISNELAVEKEKVNNLLKQLEKAKPNMMELQSYRQRIIGFENKMKELMEQINSLKQENSILKMQRDSSMYVLKEYEKSNKIFYNKTAEVDKPKTTLTNTEGIKIRNSSDKLWAIKFKELSVKTYDSSTNKENPTETKNASKVDLVKLSFSIPTNFVIRASQRTYFIQILSDKNVFMGENAEVTFSDNSKLNYSFKIIAPYKNKAIKVVENLYCENFKKGTYTVNIYDSNVLVEKTTFTLN